jgi:hypothetical protein
MPIPGQIHVRLIHMSAFLAHNPASRVLLRVSADIMSSLVVFVWVFFGSRIVRGNQMIISPSGGHYCEAGVRGG